MRPARVIAMSSLAFVAAACSDSYTGPGDPEFPDIASADESRVPDEARALYAEDAAQLTLRFLEGTRAPENRDPEFPPRILSGYYNALLHVYNQRHQARDSVAVMFRIHAFPAASTHELLVEVDPRVAWTEAWLRGEPLTGVAEIDALVTRYGLTVSKVLSPAPIHTYVVLYSDDRLDMPALAERFRPFEGVEEVDANRFAGAGNDIEGTIEPGLLRLAFSLGFGDCPAGCIQRHYWFFEVEEDGTTRYRGNNGDPIPSLWRLGPTRGMTLQ